MKFNSWPKLTTWVITRSAFTVSAGKSAKASTSRDNSIKSHTVSNKDSMVILKNFKCEVLVLSSDEDSIELQNKLYKDLKEENVC